MDDKHKKILVGCAVGCLVPLILLVGSCVSFNVWLRSPGPLLEPQDLLDEQAVGYIEWRMELDNPGTERFFDAAVDMMDKQGRKGMPSSAIFDVFHAWNQRRQTRELERLFPATGSWLLYPHGFTSQGVPEDTDPARLGQLYSFSAARVSNQIRLADWVSGLFLPRVLGENARVYRGERVYEISDPEQPEDEDSVVTLERERETEMSQRAADGEDGVLTLDEHEPFALHVFLRGEGVFAATEQAVAYRAIDHLVEPPTRTRPTRLEKLFASVPEGAQMRGALLSDDGEVALLIEAFAVEFLELEDVVEPELLRGLRDAESLVFGAGIRAEGDAWFDLVIEGPPQLEELLRRLGASAQEELAARDFQLTQTVSPSAEGIRWELEMKDLVGALERNLDEVVDEAMTDIKQELREGTRETGSNADSSSESDLQLDDGSASDTGTMVPEENDGDGGTNLD